MELKVNSGVWGTMFGVPCIVADNLLKLATGEQLKVLLFMLRNSGRKLSDEEISINTGVPVMQVQDCILVTGFNGGNSNSATGNFSYGIEGFLVKSGKIAYPVKEALMTGDFLTLWNNLIFAAEDARLCMSKLIPSIAFAGVDISA